MGSHAHLPIKTIRPIPFPFTAVMKARGLRGFPDSTPPDHASRRPGRFQHSHSHDVTQRYPPASRHSASMSQELAAARPFLGSADLGPHPATLRYEALPCVHSDCHAVWGEADEVVIDNVPAAG